MLGQLLGIDARHDAGEVDDAAHALPTGRGDGVEDVLRGLAVGLREVLAAHPVDEVVDGVHPLHRRGDLLGLQDVHRHGLDVIGPPRLGAATAPAHRRPYVVSRVEEGRDEPAPDVSA